jgi:hypothetical protein
MELLEITVSLDVSFLFEMTIPADQQQHDQNDDGKERILRAAQRRTVENSRNVG